jgi:hypothetical protein
MGRIEGIIPDDLEQQVRIEVIKRYGGKKGDLVKGITAALQLWVDSSTVKGLQEQATNPSLQSEEREHATRQLGMMGDSALDALIKVGSSEEIRSSERELAREQIDRILRERRGGRAIPHYSSVTPSGKPET